VPGSARFAVPLGIWLVTTAVVSAMARVFGYSPFRAENWSRWDSGHYEAIARSGYELHRCAAFPGEWCGSAGWFPGYSWVVGALHKVGLPLLGTAVAVSWLFGAATLVLLWNTFFAHDRRAAILPALVYAAWAPGQIYEYAIFPLSMLAFFTVAHLRLLHRGRDVAAGVTGAVAALTYPLGVLLIPVSAIWLLLRRAHPRRVATVSGLAVCGVALFVLDQKLETGRWNAYFLVQDRYGHSWQNPFVATWHALEPLDHGSPFQYVKGPALQTAVVTAAVVAVALYAARHRRTLTGLDGLVLLWAAITWIAPLSQSALSLQRSQAALLPISVLVRHLHLAVQLALIAVAFVAAAAMENLFFHGDIV
jgi:hypothetical protein